MQSAIAPECERMAPRAQQRRETQEEERVAQALLAVHDDRRARGGKRGLVRHGHRHRGIAQVHLRVGTRAVRLPRLGELALGQQRIGEVDARLEGLRAREQRGARRALGAGEVAAGLQHEPEGHEGIGIVGSEHQRAPQRRLGLLEAVLHEEDHPEARMHQGIAGAGLGGIAQLRDTASEIALLAQHEAAKGAGARVARVRGEHAVEERQRLGETALAVEAQARVDVRIRARHRSIIVAVPWSPTRSISPRYATRSS